MLLGRALGTIDRNSRDNQASLNSISKGVLSDLLKRRPDVQQAELQFRSAFENGNVAKTNFYPSLTLTAEGGFASLTLKDFFDQSIFCNLIGGLTQPIFLQCKNKTGFAIAAVKKEAVYNIYQQTILKAGQEVSDALFSYENALEKQRILKEQLVYLNKSVEFTQELLRFTSYTNYTDVLTSEQRHLY